MKTAKKYMEPVLLKALWRPLLRCQDHIFPTWADEQEMNDLVTVEEYSEKVILKSDTPEEAVSHHLVKTTICHGDTCTILMYREK